MHIAIDGPAGSGKSTIAKRLAEMLRIYYIDTGAMYRAITYCVIANGIPPGDRQGIIRTAAAVHIELKDGHVFLNGANVSGFIRSVSVDGRVSEIASIPEVRKGLVEQQRRMAENKSVVMDGRDIGTVVLPKADLKIFLTATLAERAKRRFKELEAANPGISLEQVMEKLQKRDHLDSTRGHSPLIAAEDAIIIDTTGKNIETVLKEIIGITGGSYICFTK